MVKDFKKNEYDVCLAAAHAKYKTILPDLSLRAAQGALLYLGFDPGPIDGLRGHRARSALIQFQETRGLPVTGELDDGTEDALLAEAFPV
jgi:peptidoglycan hydrolase-like protein with peptidoglycan-binding domain